LPIPLGALSIGSVVLIFEKPLVEKYDIILFSIFVILIAILMISNIKYRTMKRISSKSNLVILFSLGVIIALLINFPTYTIPSISFLYLTSPLFFFFMDKLKKKKKSPVPIESHPDESGES
jgi:phosphatidylserine synthase